MFLSSAPCPRGSEKPACRLWGCALTALMVSSRRPAGHGFPFDRLPAATPGKLPSPSEGTRRGTLAPPPSQSRFVIDLSARCIQETWNGVGLSPVSVISLCEQATPPIHPACPRRYPYPLSRRRPVQCFSMCECLAPTRGRTATPPALSLPGPFVTARYRTTLASYLSKRKVRARISGRVRTRPGRIKPSFHKKSDRTV